MNQAVRAVTGAIVIGTCGRILLQQRDDIPGILHPGLIGMFGGHREPGESALDCILRELEEELGLRFPADRAEPFGVLVLTPENAGEVLDYALYLVRDVPLDRLVVTEGQPLITDLAGLPRLYQRMTPATAFAVRQLEVELAAGSQAAAGVQAASAQQQ